MKKEEIKIFCSDTWLAEGTGKQDYELLDTGGGEKLERVGPYTFVRPYESAFWPKTLPKKIWEEADGKFCTSKIDAKPGWQLSRTVLDKWKMEYKGIKFWASPTAFRHFGFFPEQAAHFDFIADSLGQSRRGRPVRLLNLFGYTGIASLVALRAGAEVTHVDASRQSIELAKENQQVAGLENLPMRVILDDAIKFLVREIKRGAKYDAILIDPPKFGRGPKGETWKIETGLPNLLSLLPKVLTPNPRFVILTSYAIDSSSLSIKYALTSAMKGFPGEVEGGELCLKEASTGRRISLANTAVFKGN